MPHWTPIAVVCTSVVIALISLRYRTPDPSSSPEEMAEFIQSFRQLNKSCFILGASGESGKALLKEMIRLKPFSRVVLIGRRRLDFSDEEFQKLEQRVVDFDLLENHKADFDGFDVGYCCLGTTRGKAGAEGFVKIEYDYVIGSAKLALQNGCKHFHLVSSQGVNENSSYLYMKTKGRTDRVISEMGFERASIYRPGVLMCNREESRPLEAAFKFLLKPIACLAPTLMTTPTDVLARAMIMNTIDGAPSGAEILDNKMIHSLGNSIAA